MALLAHAALQFVAPNSPDLTLVHYNNWVVMQERVYSAGR